MKSFKINSITNKEVNFDVTLDDASVKNAKVVFPDEAYLDPDLLQLYVTKYGEGLELKPQVAPEISSLVGQTITNS